MHSCYAEAPCEYPRQYWNKLACQCFNNYQCKRLCPQPDQELHPLWPCQCVDKSIIRSLYPDWATEEEIRESNEKGRQAAFDRPDDWKVCPRKEHLPDSLCPNGYWNELSCNCFSQIFCMLWCGYGKDMDPTKGCFCMDKKEIVETYYPSWANEYDISVA